EDRVGAVAHAQPAADARPLEFGLGQRPRRAKRPRRQGLRLAGVQREAAGRDADAAGHPRRVEYELPARGAGRVGLLLLVHGRWPVASPQALATLTAHFLKSVSFE